jgi:hypothetical protein
MFGFGKKVEGPEVTPEVTSDVSAAEAKGEGQKLEWGPELDSMNWSETQTRISELNASLTEEEGLWRLPTADELQAESRKRNSTAQRGFMGGDYWCSSDASSYGPNRHSNVRMYDGEYGVSDENNNNLVRLVRDIV